MKLGLSVIQEFIKDIPSILVGDSIGSGLQEIRLWSEGNKEEQEIGYVAREHAFVEGGSDQCVCWFQNHYLLFETQDISIILNRILDTFSFYAKWMEHCNQMTDNGCSLAELLAISEPILGHPLLIVDSSQFIIGMSPAAISHSTTREWTAAMMDQSIAAETLRSFNAAYEDSFHQQTFFHLPADFFPSPSSCHHIFLDHDRVATLILIENTAPLSPGQTYLAKQFIPCIANWIRTCKENDSSVHGISVLAKLLDGAPDADVQLDRRLELSGWDPSCQKQLIVARSVSSSVHFDSYLSKTISNEREGIYSIPYDRKLLILVNLEFIDWEDFSRELHYRFYQNQYCGTASIPFTDIRQIPQIHRYTVETLDSYPGEAGNIFDCRIHSLEFFTKAVQDSRCPTFLHPLPDQIEEYDHLHGTEYGKTLFSFLRHERNHTLTASSLFIHRNTLFLRLRNIRELWNPDLDNPEDRFLLLYTFYHRFYNQDRGSAIQFSL